MNAKIFRDSKTFHEEILKKSIMSDHMQVGGLLDIQFSPYVQMQDKGVESQIELSENEMQILLNANYRRRNSNKSAAKMPPKYLIKEEIEGIYAFQTVVDGYIYVLIPTELTPYNYIRFYNPETTAYLDFYPPKGKIKWIGYKNEKMMGSGSGLGLLKWLTHCHTTGDLELDVVLTRKNTNSNPLCKLYEEIGYQFVGFQDRQEGFYANYEYIRL